MAQGDPLGRIALLIIIFVVFFDTVFGLVQFGVDFVSTGLGGLLDAIDNMIVELGGGEPVFPQTEQLVKDVFSWQVFIFTNAMAFAIIVFISVVKNAFQGG